MLKTLVIVLATFLFSVLVAARIALGQTVSPTSSSPTVSPVPTTSSVQGAGTVPSGAPQTGRGL